MVPLKVCLWIVGVFCVGAAMVLGLPISTMQTVLNTLGEHPLGDSPVLVHLLRTGAATYFVVGLLYIVLAWRPAKYGLLVPLFGAGAILFGLVCGISGLAAKLPAMWFAKDSAGGIIFGILIVVFWQQACGGKLTAQSQ